MSRKRRREPITVVIKPPKKPTSIPFKARNGNGYAFLSNFYPDVYDLSKCLVQAPPTFIDVNCVVYRTSEHFYQYHKYKMVIDPVYAEEVLMGYRLDAALEVKKASGQGRYVDWKYNRDKPRNPRTTKKAITQAFKAKEAKWHEYIGSDKSNVLHMRSVRWMIRGLYYKFTQHGFLRDALLATGDAKLYEQCGMGGPGLWAWDATNNKGGNALGLALEYIRKKLKETPDLCAPPECNKECGCSMKRTYDARDKSTTYTVHRCEHHPLVGYEGKWIPVGVGKNCQNCQISMIAIK
jgi:predicted NAD-dependent protein-ADP-ribosyltransferase YbiA (DUF1768 family)